MPTSYQLSLMNVASRVGGITLSSPYVAGSGSLVLSSVTGLPAVPFRLTVVTLASRGTGLNEVLTVFRVTNVNSGTNTLTLSGTLENTADRNYSIGDIAEIRDNAGAITDLNAAVSAITPTVVSGITATGSSQGTAAPLGGPCSINEVTVVASGTGVILPTPVLPSQVIVINASATPLLLYPSIGSTIAGSGLPITIAPGLSIQLVATSVSNWYAV